MDRLHLYNGLSHCVSIVSALWSILKKNTRNWTPIFTYVHLNWLDSKQLTVSKILYLLVLHCFVPSFWQHTCVVIITRGDCLPTNIHELLYIRIDTFNTFWTSTYLPNCYILKRIGCHFYFNSCHQAFNLLSDISCTPHGSVFIYSCTECTIYRFI